VTVGADPVRVNAPADGVTVCGFGASVGRQLLRLMNSHEGSGVKRAITRYSSRTQTVPEIVASSANAVNRRTQSRSAPAVFGRISGG
jgi:hypothetical protein